MNRKKVLLLHILFVGILFVGFLARSQQNSLIQIREETDRSIDEIKSSLALAEEDFFRDLEFNGEQLPYDKESNTFYLPLSIDKETFEYGIIESGDRTVSIRFLDTFEADDKLDAIAENKAYRFLAYNQNEYKVYQLVFTGMPILELTSANGKLGDSNINMQFRFLDSSEKNNWVSTSLAELKTRGNTSKLYPKKSYNLELYQINKNGEQEKYNANLLGMRSDNDWILYAMYGDDTKIRDKLCIDLWNSFGALNNPFQTSFGTRLEYVEIFLNNEYYGLYGLMVPLDAKQFNITTASADSLQEYVYKRTTPAELTLDDFQIESDTLERCGFELKGTSKYSSINLASWNPLVSYIQLYNTEEDEDYEAGASQLFDIDNVTDVWLFLQIISGFDNRGKNMYFVAKEQNQTYEFYFVPWDFDLTWGNTSSGDTTTYTEFKEDLSTQAVDWEPGDYVLSLNVEDSVSQVQEKWNKLSEDLLESETVNQTIDTLTQYLNDSGAYARDEKRWPSSPHTKEYDTLKSYTANRLEFVDTYINNLAKEQP